MISTMKDRNHGSTRVLAGGCNGFRGRRLGDPGAGIGSCRRRRTPKRTSLYFPSACSGKTGVEVTLLNQGTVGQPAALEWLAPHGLPRRRSLLRHGRSATRMPRPSSPSGSRPHRGAQAPFSWRPKAASEGPLTCCKKVDARLARLGTRLPRPASSSTGWTRARPPGPRAVR